MMSVKLAQRSNRTILFGSVLSILLLILPLHQLSAQSLDADAFADQCTFLDSLKSFGTGDDCLTFIDSLNTSHALSKDQQSFFNVQKAFIWTSQGKDSLAAIYIDKEKSYLESTGDTSGLAYSNLWEAQGQLYVLKANYEEAIKSYTKAKDLRSSAVGEMHPYYAMSLYALGLRYKTLGEYETAKDLYIQAKEVFIETLGTNHPRTARCLKQLGTIYMALNQLDEAEPLLLESLEINKNLFGVESLAYSDNINTMAYFNYKKGDYRKAAELFYQATEIEEKFIETNSLQLATSLNNLAAIYNILGENEKVEPLHIRSAEIKKKFYGKDHPEYAVSLNNLAQYYLFMGQYEKAESLYKQTKEIYFKSQGTESMKYGVALNNLATLYVKMKQYDKVEPYLLQFISIVKATLGTEHPRYALSIGNLADFYADTGAFKKAEDLYIEALVIRKETIGEKHIVYALNLNNLARLYKNIGEYAKAEPLYIESLNIKKATLGKKNDDYITGIVQLAQLYELMGEYDKATDLIIEGNGVSKNILTTAFSFLSEKGKMTFHERVIESIDALKSIGLHQNSERINTEIFNTILFEKGLHLNSNIQTKVYIQEQGDSITKNLYNELLSVKEELYNEFRKPSSDQENAANLENKIGLIEKELAKVSAKFRMELGINNLDAENIMTHLKKGEAAIEFTHFKNHADSIVYAASILTTEGNPKFIFLATEEALKRKLQIKGEGNTKFINTIYGFRERGLVTGDEIQERLYDLLWKPMEPFLNGAEKIYYSPSGLLNRLNINAIAVDEDMVLADKYEMVALFNTRTIALQTDYNFENSSYLIGGVDYDSEPSPASVDSMLASVSQDEVSLSSIDKTLRSQTWEYLKWTKSETDNINALFEGLDFNVIYRSGDRAVEDDFKSIGANGVSPRFLHLATHGYFFPDPREPGSKEKQKVASRNNFEMSAHPLLRSGLILAGGNAAWKGEEVESGNEDGILTAYEISNMNLHQTELVVLSACDTGLGDIRGSEGVYGLQRSFKMAGVKYLIMSLWQVPDRATSVFMGRFYENLLNEKMTIRDAFNKTQLEMRDRFFDPYNWAGFVLIE